MIIIFYIQIKADCIAWLYWLNTIIVTPVVIHLGYMYLHFLEERLKLW